MGIIIGKLNLNSDRGFVYDLIPTPLTDNGTPACSLKSETAGREEKKKGSKGGKSSNEPPPSLSIDGDWVAEHARQVRGAQLEILQFFVDEFGVVLVKVEAFWIGF